MELNGKNYLKIMDFIRKTGITRPTVKKYIAEKILNGIQIGRRYWIDENELVKLGK